MHKIKIFKSISDIEKPMWDSISCGNIFMCYDWLKTNEEATSLPFEPYYIMVFNEERLIGASFCYFEEKCFRPLFLDSILLGRIKKFRMFKNLSFKPVVICNSRKGYGAHFLHSKILDDDEIIFLYNELLNTIEKIAASFNVPACFLNVMDHETQLLKLLIKRGYSQTISLPLNYIDIEWNSFEEYKKHLSSKYPRMSKTVRHEINKNKKSGVVIQQINCNEDHQLRLIELLEMNHKKYENTKFPLKPNYFKLINDNFGKNAVIYAAFKGNNIIGVNVEVRKENEAILTCIGIDHEISEKDLTYFNLAFYEPMKNAISFGLKRLYYGNSLYKAKAKRGQKIAPAYIFYKSGSKFNNIFVKIWFVIHNLWMRHKFSYLRDL
jgi:predicted N-acyltransferase